MIAALLLAQAAVAGQLFDAPALPDEVLAEHRGGVRLPNGIDLAMTVQTQTAVNGSIVLQTVFAVTNGTPTMTVYTPEPGRTVGAPKSEGSAASPMSTLPSVVFDRRSGLQVYQGNSATPVKVSTGGGNGPDALPEGLQSVDPSSPVRTDAGVVTSSEQGRVHAVNLAGPGLNITHFAGDAFGSAIANSRNDAVINTDTTVSMDLRNAGPDVLGSAILRVEDVALGAVSSRMQP